MKLRATAAAAAAAAALMLTASCGLASETATTRATLGATSGVAPDQCSELLAATASKTTADKGNPLAAAESAYTKMLAQDCPGYWSRECAELTEAVAALDTGAVPALPGLDAARRTMTDTLRTDACEKARR